MTQTSEGIAAAFLRCTARSFQFRLGERFFGTLGNQFGSVPGRIGSEPAENAPV